MARYILASAWAAMTILHLAEAQFVPNTGVPGGLFPGPVIPGVNNFQIPPTSGVPGAIPSVVNTVPNTFVNTGVPLTTIPGVNTGVPPNVIPGVNTGIPPNIIPGVNTGVPGVPPFNAIQNSPTLGETTNTVTNLIGNPSLVRVGDF